MKVSFQRLDRLYLQNRKTYQDIFDSLMNRGNFVLGEEVAAFEKEYAAYCHAKHCVGVASGLDALTLSLNALDFKPGEEVMVPANTYIATWIAVSRAGLKPVPVEPEKEGFQIDVNRLRNHITDRTKAIMPVHLYYQTPEMDELNEFAEDHGLKVITDAAQGHGAYYKGKVVGSTAETEAFSFFPTKNLGAFGDGGAVVTNDGELAEKIRILRNYGTRKKYISETMGYNSRLDEMQAAFLRHKLKNLEEWNSRRRSLADLYLSELDTEILSLPEVKEHNKPNWHIFPVMSKHRDELSRELDKLEIQTIVHYPVPPFDQGAYATSGLKGEDFPLTRNISEQILSLPMHPYLTDEEAMYVVDSINSISRKLGGEMHS